MHTGVILFLQVLCWVPLLTGPAEPNRPANQSIDDANAPGIRMMVRDSYLPGVPVLVRVEITGPNGVVNRDIWDANAVLAVSGNPTIRASVNRFALYNGLGSALVTFTGRGDFELTANVNGMEKTATLADWTGQPVPIASGILRRSQTWSGVYRITGGDFTIPAGYTLTLEPGTLVLIDGVPSGSDGTDIDVQGSIQSLGTAASPVTFTACHHGPELGRAAFRRGAAFAVSLHGNHAGRKIARGRPYRHRSGDSGLEIRPHVRPCLPHRQRRQDHAIRLGDGADLHGNVVQPLDYGAGDHGHLAGV